eukprot:CAMPEP_0184482320 /NCGR_PEP_ID=MMETSP0113_2-20130426/3876_1 /TAXON_ID=91329 /ORGANISM="Norrisiella sphaerica, Strain BC52" /LENGTH=882 /DNA_ID=CAMNT_0026861977 /DNA_START=262 /DNA_END=2910 /DNA_ORIENTATION=-
MKNKDVGKPLSLFYIADRLDTDDPIRGYMVRSKQTGWLQGFVITTTFTTWQRWFKWDSLTPQAGIMDKNGGVRACCANRKVDADGALAKELNDQLYHGDVKAEGIIWPRVAEISLLGALGCGGWLVGLVLEEMQRNNEYDWVVLQALDNSIGFYEKMGFTRVGAIAKYFQEKEDEDVGNKSKRKLNKDTLSTTKNQGGRTVGYRHWTWDDESINALPKPSYMMAKRIIRRPGCSVGGAGDGGGHSSNSCRSALPPSSLEVVAVTTGRQREGQRGASQHHKREKRRKGGFRGRRAGGPPGKAKGNEKKAATKRLIEKEPEYHRIKRLQELLVKRPPAIKVTKKLNQNVNKGEDEEGSNGHKHGGVGSSSSTGITNGHNHNDHDEEMKKEHLWAWECAVPQDVLNSHLNKHSSSKKKNVRNGGIGGTRGKSGRLEADDDHDEHEEEMEEEDESASVSEECSVSSDYSNNRPHTPFSARARRRLSGGRRGSRRKRRYLANAEPSTHQKHDLENTQMTKPTMGSRGRTRQILKSSIRKTQRGASFDGNAVNVRWHLDVKFLWKENRDYRPHCYRITKVTKIPKKYLELYNHDGSCSSTVGNRTKDEVYDGRHYDATYRGSGRGKGRFGLSRSRTKVAVRARRRRRHHPDSKAEEQEWSERKGKSSNSIEVKNNTKSPMRWSWAKRGRGFRRFSREGLRDNEEPSSGGCKRRHNYNSRATSQVEEEGEGRAQRQQEEKRDELKARIADEDESSGKLAGKLRLDSGDAGINGGPGSEDGRISHVAHSNKGNNGESGTEDAREATKPAINARLAVKTTWQEEARQREDKNQWERKVRLRGIDPKLQTKYGKEIYVMRNMGFRDNRKIVNILRKCNGDVRVALETMLSSS